MNSLYYILDPINYNVLCVVGTNFRYLTFFCTLDYHIQDMKYKVVYFRYSEATMVEFLHLASAIDPRFKSLPYVDDSRREDVFSMLQARTTLAQEERVINICYSAHNAI